MATRGAPCRAQPRCHPQGRLDRDGARRGASWRSVGFARPLHLGHAAAWAIGTFLVLILILPVVLEPIAAALALPPQPRGVLNASAIGLVAAGVYLADSRNLWPLIIAHGLVDTVSLTFLRLGMGHG